MCCVAKMWGPGAEQGVILQMSSCRLDLKEPYYQMSQPGLFIDWNSAAQSAVTAAGTFSVLNRNLLCFFESRNLKVGFRLI